MERKFIKGFNGECLNPTEFQTILFNKKFFLDLRYENYLLKRK